MLSNEPEAGTESKAQTRKTRQTKMTTRTIENLAGVRERVSLPNPHYTGNDKIGTGETLRALYSGPRTGRRFAHTYSIWEDRCANDGTTIGDVYAEIDEITYLRYCEIACCDPIGVISAVV